ncbi:MAG: TAXI family TRAP transporter solute-binding subunit [Geminicoccaceae bacterium]
MLGHAKTRRGVLAAALIAGFGSAVIAAPATAQEEQNFILATATTGGTYYPVGVALATLVKVKLQPSDGIGMSAINSAGSGENVKLMREDQAQFSILQGLYGEYAWKGTGPLESEGQQEQLRSVTMLWQNVEHFLLLSDKVDSGTIDDLGKLAGERFSIGAKNSGTEGSGRHLLGNLGIDPESLDLAYLGYGPSADALQNGQIIGANIPAGVPVGAVTQAFAVLGDGLTVLDFTDEQMARANGEGDLWGRYVIPAETYPGQSADINTIAQPNFLAVNADVDEEAVYLITKTIYENLPFLQNIHAATKAMALDKAIGGLPAPLHPGAAKYYQEQGIEIPERLIAG